MSGPGATCRRSGPSGNDASSSAGSPSGSSVGVGACTTGSTPPGSRPAGSRGPPGSGGPVTGTAQHTDHDVRVRSSDGRSASSPGASRPPAVAVRQRLCWLAGDDPSTVIVTSSPSRAAVSTRVAPPASISMELRAGKASSSAGPACASSRSASSREPGSRRGRVTAVANPSGGVPSAGNGSRSTGTCPDRSASSPASAGTWRTSSRVSSRDHWTEPVTEDIRGASLTAATAANPTPNRPTASCPRLLDARSVDRASTPAASSGAPVFAATRIPSRNVSRSRPGTPARAAASAAFCASSTTTRSRYPPSA